MQHATVKYLSGAGANQVVTTEPAILIGIWFGADVASGDVEISDDVADGDINVIAQFTGSTLMTSTGGGVTFGPGIHCHKGITIDSTNQTKMTVAYIPVA
jgi:hypothetical protein